VKKSIPTKTSRCERINSLHETVCLRFGALGKDVLAVKADTAELSEVEKFLGNVEQKFGKIDILFINAGVAKFASLAETPESLFVCYRC